MKYQTGDVVMMLPTKNSLTSMFNWHICIVHSFIALYGGLKIVYLVEVDKRSGMTLYCQEAELFKIGVI